MQLDHDLKHAHELRQAAFKLYASLGSNDEDIRKKVGAARPVCMFLLSACVHVFYSNVWAVLPADHRDGEHDGQDSERPV